MTMMNRVGLTVDMYDSIIMSVTKFGSKTGHSIVRSKWKAKTCVVMLIEPPTNNEDKKTTTQQELFKLNNPDGNRSVYGIVHKKATSFGNSGHVIVPSTWIGKKVIVMLIEPLDGDLTNNTYKEKVQESPVGIQKDLATGKTEEDKQTDGNDPFDWKGFDE